MSHELPVRVYYEDTDLAGIVYYANYLKFIERGRSEWLRAIGINQVTMKSRGAVFAVRRVEADYLHPARFDDQLTVRTRLTDQTAARVVLHQEVLRNADLLFTAQVTIVCLNGSGRPIRLPAMLRQALETDAIA